MKTKIYRSMAPGIVYARCRVEIAAERRLPSPAPVPSESRAVRVTELPVARWQRLNASPIGASQRPMSARGAA